MERLPSPLAAAEHALTLTATRPDDARDEAIRILRTTDEEEARVVAIRALGRASHELGNLHAALHHLKNAVRKAEEVRLERRAGEARMTLAGVLTEYGEPAAALHQIERAGEVLTGADAGRLLGQRAFVLTRLGRFDEALTAYHQAIPRIHRAGDARFEAGMLMNRGKLNIYRGNIRQGETDLRRCEEVATRAGLEHMVALIRVNVAFAAVRRGDIPRTLELMDDAERRLDGAEERIAFARVERAQALLQANLVEEAREVLTSAVERIDAGGYAADGAEARLFLTQAQMLDRDPTEARTTAQAAYVALVRQRRSGWAYYAKHLMVMARWQGGERSQRLLRDARESTSHLLRWGWEVPAAQSRLVTGRLALELGDLQLADRELEQASRNRLSGPVHLRVAAWHARALQRLAQQDRRGASAALRAGLRAVDEHAGSLGATDLRVHAIGWGRELATLGMRLALSSGRPSSVFTWMERWRAGATRHRPVRPPDDLKLAAALAELRRVTADLSNAAAEGRGSAAQSRSIRALRSRQVRLEDEIRQRTRLARGTYQGPRPQPTPASLSTALDGRAFIAYADHGGELAAITIVDGRTRLIPVGSYRETLQAMEALRFCIHRLARRHGSAASLAAARKGIEQAGTQVQRLLLAPLMAEIGDRELVISPTGRLHAMPWSAVPALAERPLTLTPSAAMWLDTLNADRSESGQRSPARETVLVAGPDLHHAETEVAALAGHYRHPTRLTGEHAGVDVVRSAIDGADLAHLAAHGRFRADNPLFSSIALADGPLMVYDMERLTTAPRRMILSACDAAVSAVRPGNELMGLTSALLSLGTATLIASVSPVHDDETRQLMVRFHDRLARGSPPARALAEATHTSGVLGFTCFGAG